MNDEKYLYLVMHPNHALIASQLDPERFARHYTQGSTRYFEGRLIFLEVDPTFRHPFFKIDQAFAELKPHEDGRPKATKFISSYRTFEHMDFNAFGKLYYCNSLGDFVRLESAEYKPDKCDDEMRIVLEINPIKMMVLTRYNFMEYAKFITDPNVAKGAPVMFYSQLDVNIDDFLREYQDNPFIRCFVPGIHPARLREAILEVRAMPGKNTKGLSLDCPIDRISYKLLHHGFMLASAKQTRFYPLLSQEDVERQYYKFWKTM